MQTEDNLSQEGVGVNNEQVPEVKTGEPSTGTPPELSGEPKEAPKEEPKTVPLAALEDERRKRQALEKKNIENEKQAAYYRGLAAGVRPSEKRDAKQDSPPVRPKMEDFDDWEKFEEAKDQYISDATAYRIRQEYATAMRKQSEDQARQTVEQRFQQRIATASLQEPELPHMIEVVGTSITPTMGEAIRSSEAAPQIVAYLYNNASEMQRLNSLPQVSLLKEMGKLEDRLLNPPKPEVKKISTAPAPAEDLKSSGNVVTEIDLDKADMRTYVAERRKQALGGR